MQKRPFVLLAACLLAVLAGALPGRCRAADKDTPKLPELNRQIVAFCTDNLGKKVGNGECAVLAFQAYEKAGAKMPADLPEPKPPMTKEDYIWGRLLKPDEEVLPGDVIQFHDVEIKVTLGRSFYSFSYPHHTAIVAEVKGKQKFTIFQQNVDKPGRTDEQRRLVQKDSLDLNGKVKGTVWIYRPLEK